MDSEKKFKYKILPELALIIEFWKGEFMFKEIIELKTLESSHPDWKASYNVLSDARLSIMELNFDNANKDDFIGNYTQENAEKFAKHSKTALLTNFPHQVVMSILLQNKIPKEIKLKVKEFSTVGAALKWLGINSLEFERINNILEQLHKD